MSGLQCIGPIWMRARGLEHPRPRASGEPLGGNTAADGDDLSHLEAGSGSACTLGRGRQGWHPVLITVLMALLMNPAGGRTAGGAARQDAAAPRCSRPVYSLGFVLRIPRVLVPCCLQSFVDRALSCIAWRSRPWKGASCHGLDFAEATFASV